jgi:hypothetical protein
MTTDEINNFRKEFASIVYVRNSVKTYAYNLRKLESWNKNGSHDNAIKRSL